MHTLDLAAGPELLDDPGVDFPDVHLSQSLRPDTARLAPIPIITSPPVPPMISIRRGERASHARAVPATSAQALSQTTAIAMKIAPSSSI